MNEAAFLSFENITAVMETILYGGSMAAFSPLFSAEPHRKNLSTPLRKCFSFLSFSAPYNHMRNHLTNLKGLAQKMDAAGLDISLPSLHWSDTLQRSAKCRVNSNTILSFSLFCARIERTFSGQSDIIVIMDIHYRN